jgi:hypothetical protein
MTLETFWHLIDESRNASGRLVEMPEILTEALCKLDEQEIVEFWSHHLDCLHRSYDARLWLAAVLLMNGCGDDTFTDFRDWLIAQGKARFEAALEDPDSLADLEKENFDGDHGYPLLFYLGGAPSHAFCKKASGDERDSEAQMRFRALLPKRKYPGLRNRNLINGDEAEARAMFPRLAGKFPTGVRRRG